LFIAQLKQTVFTIIVSANKDVLVAISKKELTRIKRNLNNLTPDLTEWKKEQEKKKKLMLLLKKAESFIKE